MFTTASAGAASKRSSVSGLFQGKRPFNCRIHQRKTWKASDRTCLCISAAGTPHMAMERLRVDEEQPSTCCCLWTSTTASQSKKEPNRGSQDWQQQQFSHLCQHRTALDLLSSRTTWAALTFLLHKSAAVHFSRKATLPFPSLCPSWHQSLYHPTYHHWVPPDASFLAGHSPVLLCEVHQTSSLLLKGAH